ncbi:MAG: ribosome maturation factor RimP [Clostridia bacterium]|nr:ribosome maturation factor RimP [Oscillospiraceae bacterium]MBQ6797532.1 ribosome maturation factor RimP [Clostridia bacterium]
MAKSNSSSKGGNTVSVVSAIAEPVAKQLGLDLWDVRFEKEGASWYLRIFIDKKEGISIDDCEKMSKAVDPLIEEADPIDQSYFLEVCSPGIERELRRPEHFEKMSGREVCVRLFRPLEDGTREVIADLVGLRDGSIVLTDLDGTEFEIPKKEAVSVCLTDEDIEFETAQADETEE